MNKQILKVRVFMAVVFLNEEDLIRLLPLIEKKGGKYDYFSQNISLDPLTFGPGYHAKLFSFALLYDIEKAPAFYQKMNRYFADEKECELHFGYINRAQVISYHQTPSLTRIQISDDTYAQLQLIYENKGFGAMPRANPLFGDYKVKQYFNDLNRVYKKEIS